MPLHRPTILQIIPSLDTGGAELSTVEIAQAIVASGGRALVATTGGRLAPRIIEAGGEIIPFPAATKNPVQMTTNVQALARIIHREQVDLVHARSRAPAWSALGAARATKRPFITTYHGAYAEKGPLKRAYNSIMAKGDLVIANSAYTASLIASRYGTTADRIRIIHRGVDSEALDPATIAHSRLETLVQSFGIASGQPVILHAARLTRWKGQGVVIDSLAKLPPSNWVAVFAGDDQGRSAYSDELARQVEALGLSARIKFVGHVHDMAAALALSHVAIIASTEPEAFGRTAIEAQMMGCPVIATRIGAPPETVLAEPDVPAEQRTGWLIPPGDPMAMTQALTAALTLDPTERANLAARARAHATAHFSLSAMQRATLEVYDQMLGTQLAATFEHAAQPGPKMSHP